MSIVFMECSIEMYYSKRSSGRSSEEYDTQNLSGRLRVSSENIYLPLPPGPLDTQSVISRPVPIMILLSGGTLSTAGSIPSRACQWLPRRRSAQAVDSEWTLIRGTAASCWTALIVAGHLRRHQVGSTTPAWAASKTQAGPCHFRVKSANSRRVGEPALATLQTRTDSDVTGSGMVLPLFHLQEYG